MSYPPQIVKSDTGLEFVHYVFHNVEGKITGHDAILTLSMHYDEYMGMVKYDKNLLRESPLAPMRQWDMETHGVFSKERERMRLYSKMRIAEFIPGMTWDQFTRLTPEQTEWVLEIAREGSAVKSKQDTETENNLKQLTSALGGKGKGL